MHNRLRRRRPLFISLVFSIILIAVYVVFLKTSDDQSNLSEVVLTILGIIAGVAFWLEYHHNNKLNEAEFIVELNKQFVADENMTRVEHDLERYFALVRNSVRNFDEEKYYLNGLKEKYDLKKEDRQHLINYLVHLEGIATLISTGVIRLKTINDLMGYRFFIAVNNPVVQQIELFPYAAYYKGIFALFDEWKNNKDMPLNEKEFRMDYKYQEYQENKLNGNKKDTVKGTTVCCRNTNSEAD